MKIMPAAETWKALSDQLVRSGHIKSTADLRALRRNLHYGFMRLRKELSAHCYAVYRNRHIPADLREAYLFELRNLREYINRQDDRHSGDIDAALAEARAANARRKRAGQPLIGQRGAFWANWAPPHVRAAHINAFAAAGVKFIPFTTRESRAARTKGFERLAANISAEIAVHQPADKPWKALFLLALRQAQRRMEEERDAVKYDPVAWTINAPIKWESYCSPAIKTLLSRARESLPSVALDWHEGIPAFYDVVAAGERSRRPTLSERIATAGAAQAREAGTHVGW